MTDEKITQIVDATTVFGTDLMPMVKNMSGTPQTVARAVSALESYLTEKTNYLINGGFDFAQRLSTPTTLTTIADKGFGADRWRQAAENASWQYAQTVATGETGLTSRYYGTFKKITSTGKGFFSQIVEGFNSVPMRGKTVVFQIKMKASASKTIRMGIFELQSAGAIDTPPAALISAFGANTVDPTMGSNVAIITGAQSKAVTTAWQSFSISVTVPTNSKNLICAVWTDSQFAANDTLSVAEAGLFVAENIQSWVPKPIQQELALCQRYYEVIGAAAGAICVRGYLGASGYFQNSIYYKVTKFAAPTVTKTGTWTVSNCNQPAVYGAPGVDACSIYSQISGAAGDSYFQTASSSTYLTVESEI